MAMKCDFKLKLAPNPALLVKGKFAIAWKQFHQECVTSVKRESPKQYGNLMRSINPAGELNSRGDRDVNLSDLLLEIFGTCGYSGYQNSGTRWMAGKFYFERGVQLVADGAGRAILEGCI